MICIEKGPLLNELQNMIDGLDGKPWSKRDKVRELTRLRVFIQTRDEIDPCDPNYVHALPARMITELEPLIPHGSIGKENYYCGNCKTRVKKQDNYCRRCGYAFTEDDEDGMV